MDLLKGKTLLVTRSSESQPPQSYLADAAGKRLAWIEALRQIPVDRVPAVGRGRVPAPQIGERQLDPGVCRGSRHALDFLL